MTAPVLPQSPSSAAPAPSSTPPGTPAGGTPSPTPPAWRAPDNAPSWARGKTADEILGIANTLMEVASTPARAEPAAPAAPPPPALRDDEYVTGADVRRYFEGQPRDTGALDLAANAVLGVARTAFARDFTRWGGEIENMLRNVPKNQWTLDNIQQVVRMVRSDHVDELAQEIATERVNAMTPTLRSTGATPSTPVPREHSMESDKIPQIWKDRAKANGVTEAVVAEFCRANDMTEADFYKQFEKPMNRIVEEHGNKKA